jgi:hypothetical protein
MKDTNMGTEVTREIKYKRVLVFGAVATYKHYLSGKPAFLYGPTKQGLRLASIAASHVKTGHEVVYEEYRDPEDTNERTKNNVYADCLIRNPLA